MYGQVWAWGLNFYGQVGDGSTVNRSLPVRVTGIGEVVAIDAGIEHSLAVRADGSVWAWGKNTSGQIGDGSLTHRYSPVVVSGGAGLGAVTVGASRTQSFAVARSGTVLQWGVSSSVPQVVRGAFGASQISAEDENVLVVAAGPWPNIVVYPTAHDFGSVKLSTAGSASVSITNNGSAPLVLGSAAATGADGTAFRLSPDCAGDIAVGASCDAQVTFTPTRGGPYASVMRFSTNAFEQFEVTLTGTGNLPPVAQSLTVTTDVEEPVIIRVAAVDPEGDAILSYGIAAGPSQGSLTAGDEPGEFLYRPLLGFTGVDRFYFVANDGGVYGPSAAVTITVGTAPAPLSLDGEITVASATVDGQPANGRSYSSRQALSRDGRFLVFTSHASNLVPGDTNGVGDVFVLDRRLGTVTRVSVTSSGAQADRESLEAVISGDGRYIAFLSDACYLAPYGCGPRGAFVHDLVTRKTTAVTVSPGGGPPNGGAGYLTISENGRYVAVGSHATNLVTTGDANGSMMDVFLVDRDADGDGIFDQCCGRTSIVLASVEGSSPLSVSSHSPWLAADGSRLVFITQADVIYMYDRASRVGWRAALRGGGTPVRGSAPSLNDNGSLLAFGSSDVLGPLDTNGTSDVFVAYVAPGPGNVATAYTRVSLHTNGAQAAGSSVAPAMSGDGRFVTFRSNASNLDPNDTSSNFDVYLHDRLRLTTTFLSPAPETGPATAGRDLPAISSGGNAVAFSTNPARCLADGSACYSDVFVAGPYDRAPRVTAVSPAAGPTLGGTAVTITGSDFRAGASVAFGAAAAASVTVLTGTTLTAVTPAHTAGTVGVSVTNRDGLSGSKAAGFVYEKTAATLTLLGLTQTYDGSPKAVSVATDPPGLATVTVTYNGSPDPPSAVGTYDVVATLDHPDYAGTSTGVLTIVAPTMRQLSVSIAGRGAGAVTSDIGDIACPGGCEDTYASGAMVTLTAAAAAGSVFTGWSGDADCHDGRVTMTASLLCIASFGVAPRTHEWVSNGPHAGANISALAVHPTNPMSAIAAADYPGTLRRTDNAGAGWTSLPGYAPPIPAPVYSMAVNPADPDEVYFGGVGVMKTADGGVSFVDASVGLPPSQVVRSLAVDPNAPATVYAAADNSALWKTTDGGASWVPTGLPPDVWVNALAVSLDGSRVIAGTETGVYESTDGGASWRHHLAGAYVVSVAIDPTAPGVLYAGSPAGVFRSEDGGASWVVNETLPHTVNAIAIDPSQPTTLYAAVQESGVYMSPDAGASWWPINEGLTTPNVGALGLRGPLLYVATGDGVFVRKLGPSLHVIAGFGGAVHIAPTGTTCPVEGGSGCIALFEEPTEVVLTPEPLFGWVFAGWTGSPECRSGAFTVTQVHACRASFELAPATTTLTVSLSGGGGGTVTSSPSGIACPGACTADFLIGSTVTLVAAAEAGSTFTGWSGACSGSASCVVALDAAASVTATFRPTGTDLVVTALTDPPATALPEATFSVSDTTRNEGTVATVTSATRYYLSGASSVLLTASRSVAALGSGAESTGTVTVSIPGTTPAGTYQLIACADDTRKNAEVDETNNCRAAGAITVQLPDLTSSAVSGPASVYPGAAMTVADTVTNVGPVGAASSSTRYYLSPDQAWDAADVLLTGARSVEALAAGQSSAGSRKVTVPSATPIGMYRVLACADDREKVREVDDTNNCAASAATLLVGMPDLVTPAVAAAPSALAPGGKLTVTDTVRNDGNVGAGASTTRYYLSADGTFDGGDVLLTGSRPVGTLAPGAVSSGNKTVTLPLSLADGSYHVIACADAALKVEELSESNNCTSGPIVVVGWPDLVVSEVSDPPAEVTAGGKFSVTDTVRNDGTVPAGASAAMYFLSIDGSKNAGDVQLTGTRPVTALTPGAQSRGSRTVTVPAGTAPGAYYLLACADGAAKVGESNEENNCRPSAPPVTVR
jgi:subtilase family serine protease